jgi:uncharacterized protein (TIGR00251 family)
MTVMRLDIRVIPRSPRTRIGGTRDGRVLVRVTAPPVDGAANDAVIAAFAEALAVPRRAIRIVAGERSRNKTVEITSGVDPEVIQNLERSTG